MITFGWANLETLLGEGLEDITIQNFEEVEPHKDAIPLAIDWDHLRQSEKIGTYRVVAAHVDGELVGYDSFFINRHTRHKETIVAVNDVIYLIPEMRQGMVGARQVRESDRLLAEAGVVKIDRGCQENMRIGKHRGTVGDLFVRLGYIHTESRYTKILR